MSDKLPDVLRNGLKVVFCGTAAGEASAIKGTCQLVKKVCYHWVMKSLPVGEIKAQFSEVLEKVQQGESFEIVYGKKKKPVARIVPINGEKPKKKRKIGIWEGKVKFVFADNFKITDEELLDMRG